MKWVVTFAGSRDRYQVPLALAEDGRLDHLVTDFYAARDTGFRRIFACFPDGARIALARRYEYGLNSGLVKWSLTGLLSDRLLCRSQAERDQRLAKMAGDLARRNDSGLISYSYYGYRAFHAYGLERWPKILLQVHPHPASVRKIFSEELEHSDFGGSSLLRELELSSEPSRLDELSGESLLADHCIVASTFSKRTLVENGVPEDRIDVVPYGVDPASPCAQAKEGCTFRVVFVGQLVQRKGLEYLLKAWRRLRLPKAELILAGRGNVDRSLLAAYSSDFKYLGAISNTTLKDLYCTSDLFCMPSLVEGFGMVYLEALACGIPVIATPNTGAADIIQEGREGFIVPIRDVDALAVRLEWAYENRAALAEMGIAARKLADQYPRARFRRGVLAVIHQVEKRGAISRTQTNSSLSPAPESP